MLYISVAANFSCAADGDPEPTVQWYWDGVLIEGATDWDYSFNYINESSEGLVLIFIACLICIPCFWCVYAGSFNCIATNSAGSASSSSVQLIVKDIPSITVNPVSWQAASPGETAVFNCDAMGALVG